MPEPKLANHKEECREAPVSKSEIAKTSSAQSRINIPFSFANWKARAEAEVEQLSWFHQHLLEEDLTYHDATQALGYDRSTVYRILKGTYSGSWTNVIDKIKGYKKLVVERRLILHAEFRETALTKLICNGLSYALQNNSMTLIIGESRMGKTETSKYWRDKNNHGRTVYVTAPAYGGPKALLREIAFSLGINRNTSIAVMHESILRAFNKNRMLIIDEGHRLLPSDGKANPVALEIVRDIHDRTHCGLAIIATERFSDTISKSEYQFEQVIGRIGMPIRLGREIQGADIKPIITQYIPNPSKAVNKELLKIANSPGRLGILCETLKVASKLAKSSNTEITNDTVMQAIKLRSSMMGETQFARK